MSILDDLYSVMLAEVGDAKSVPDLWKRYLASLGYTQSTVLGQMQAFAEAEGMSIMAATNYVASGSAAPSAPTNLLTNGDFSDGATAWTVPAGVTITGGASVWANTGTARNLEQNVTTTNGVTYRLTFNISGWVNNTSGHTLTASFRGGTTAESGVFVFGDGPHTIEWVSNGNTLLRLRSGTTFEATVDDFVLIAI